MKRIAFFTIFSIAAYFVTILTGCKKNEQQTLLPVLTSTDASSITSTSVFVGGNITSDGGAKITARGVCWRTSEDPTIGDSITKDGEGIGKFTSNINRLTLGTTYYIRAYATNSVGTAYGNNVTFTTKFEAPKVTTTLPILASASVESGGMIISDGGQPVTIRGICWSTTYTPTVSDNKTSDGTGTGNFISQLKDLYHGGTYYIRAYASNSTGTGYGNVLCFVLDVDGNLYHTVPIANQLWMVENLKTTHYSTGAPIPNITDNTSWSSLKTGAYCSYNNDSTRSTTYGQLYNFHAVFDIRRLAPYGWHIADDTDWKTLINYLGGYRIAGGKIKDIGTTYWKSPNDGATNESGLCALPGGERSITGTFSGIGYKASFWSSYRDQTNAYCLFLGWDNSIFDNTGYSHYTSGFSVRCLQDQH